MGFLTDIPTGFPGYTGRIPGSAATLPRILRDNGYSTFAVGKWHLAPRWEQSASGPFDHWPLGLGFERYYGFLGRRHEPVDARARARQRLRRAAGPARGRLPPHRGPRRPGQPARSSTSARPRRTSRSSSTSRPARCTPRTTRRASGSTATAARFDDGWEAWRERARSRGRSTAGIVPEGTVLPDAAAVGAGVGRRSSADERRLFARDDGGVRRLPQPHRRADRSAARLPRGDRRARRHARAAHLRQRHERRGRADRLVQRAPLHPRPAGRHRRDARPRSTSSAASASYTHYPWGWAWAGNTPLRLWKRYTWLGGVRTPLIAHWPSGITDGGAIRSQFCHAVDLMPTICDAIGIDVPERVDGVEQLAARRREPAADLHRRRRARRPRARSTSRCSGRGRSTTTGGRRRPTTSASSSASSRRRSRAATTSTTTTGRCST